MAGEQTHRDVVRRRLRRIEGQVRGSQRMVGEETYRIGVLTQVAATNAAGQSALSRRPEHKGNIPPTRIRVTILR
ncbi:metal-sensing transcriptional repressor [Streptomyces coeruleorubidus]|uniref:metal-sensing transcriptional repressor n=1 Tax=Streptomyces coeruleorubidus TaxID=116188 RepID=UPI0036C7B21C